jgi:hypothetical protein
MENEYNCKFVLCVLLTQLGKTFAAINRIITEIKQDEEIGKSIHIVFTMNTLLNNTQFSKRLDNIENIYGKGSVCIFSSKYEGKYKHVKNRLELQGLCMEGKIPSVVVMCSNHRRYDDGVEFLKILNNNRDKIQRVYAYYDELHKYISELLREQIEEVDKLEIVKGIIALTATPDKIFIKMDGNFWNKLRLIYLDEFNCTNYAGYNDMVFNCVDDFFQNPYIRPKPFDFDELDSQTIGFISHVLNLYPNIIQDNTRTFIPAHVRRNSHNTVRDLVFNINENCVVIVINGFEKTLQYKDSFKKIKTIPLDSDNKGEEVCETISRLVKKYKLETRPIVITGFLCVSMGQTLTHKDLGSFTSAIFGHLDLTNDDLYQLFGRITGRIKDWSNYTQTQIYCPSIAMHRFHVMEECARKMASDHNGDIVTQDIYRKPMNEMGEEGRSAIENIRKVRIKKNKKEIKEANPEDYRIYDDEEIVKIVLKKFGKRYTKPVSKQFTSDGFIKASDNSVSSVLSTNDAIKAVSGAYGGAKNGKKGQRVLFRCYKDVTDKNTLRYLVVVRDEDKSKLNELVNEYHHINFDSCD